MLLTTQYLDEADQLAGQIAVLHHGRVIANGTPDQLKAMIGGDRLDVVLRDGADLPAAAELLAAAVGTPVEIEADARRLSAPARDRIGALGAAVRVLQEAGIEAEDVALRRPTLDEVFLHLTGRDAEEVAA